MSSRARVVVNVLSNWGGQFFALALSFFLAPFIVHRLGDSAYGVWTLIVAISGYMALLDLGVRGAVTRYVAGFSASGRDDDAGRTASSALQIFLATGSAVVLVSIVLALFAVDRFKIPDEYVGAAKIILVLAGLNVGVSLVSGVYAGVIAARQRFDLLNVVEVATGGVRALGFVLALLYGHGLVVMAAIQLVVSVLRGVWLVQLSRSTYPALQVRLARGDRSYLKLIFSFSVFTFLIHISGRVIYYTDALIIGASLPIGMLTFFAIGGSLVDHGRTLISSISFTATPMASALEAVGENTRVQRLLLESGRFSTMILLPVALTFLIRGESFIGLWMGPEYAAASGDILMILTLPLLLYAGTHGLGGIMMGIGKHKPMVVAMLVESALNLTLSLALVRSMGIHGVAWGTAIPSIASSLLFWPWYVQRAVGIGARRYFGTIWGRPVIALLPFATCTYVVQRLWSAGSLATFAAQVAACVVVAVCSYWWVCFDRRQREDIVAAVRRRVAVPVELSAG